MMAKQDFYRDRYDERLTRSVSDFAMFVLQPFPFSKANRKQRSSFVASSLSSARYHDAGKASAQVHNAAQKLNAIESTLPARFHPKFAEMCKWLPVIFGHEYQVLNHADLEGPNTHVDESSGAIPGIVDWKFAEFGPFGMALGALEFFLGVQTADPEWIWHPQHHHLRAVFYQALCENLTKYQFCLDPDAVEAARAFSLFTTFAGSDKEDPKGLYLMTLDACLAEATAVQPLLQ